MTRTSMGEIPEASSTSPSMVSSSWSLSWGGQGFGQYQRDVHVAGGEDGPPGDGAVDIRRDDGVAGEDGGEDLLHPGQDGLRLLLSLETDVVNHRSAEGVSMKYTPGWQEGQVHLVIVHLLVKLG